MNIFSVLNVFIVCMRNTARSKSNPLLCTHLDSYMFSTLHPLGIHLEPFPLQTTQSHLGCTPTHAQLARVTLPISSPTSSSSSGSSLPLIFCIHVRYGPIYWGAIYLAKKIIRYGTFQNKGKCLYFNTPYQYL